MRVERDQFKAGMVVVGMFVVFGLGVLWPLSRKRANVETSITELDTQISQNRTATVGLTALGEQIVDFQQQIDNSHKIVPRDSELASLLRKWSNELEAQQTTDQDIQTQPTVLGEDYNLIPIRLKFRGSFMAAFRFLRHIESLNRLIRIGQLEVTGNPERPDEPLMIRIELVTFSMPG